MEIFMLNEARQMAEFRQIAAKKIGRVHETKNACRFSLSTEDARENFPRRFAITKLTINEAESPAKRIGQFRTERELAFLRMLERLHHFFRLSGEKLCVSHVQLAVATEKISEVFFL